MHSLALCYYHVIPYFHLCGSLMQPHQVLFVCDVFLVAQAQDLVAVVERRLGDDAGRGQGLNSQQVAFEVRRFKERPYCESNQEPESLSISVQRAPPDAWEFTCAPVAR